MTFQEDAKFGVNGMKNKVSFLRILTQEGRTEKKVEENERKESKEKK